jgi:hypothetical protein
MCTAADVEVEDQEQELALAQSRRHIQKQLLKRGPKDVLQELQKSYNLQREYRTISIHFIYLSLL